MTEEEQNPTKELHPEWPDQGEHLFSNWMVYSGYPKATQYRKCVHPSCLYWETRDAPKG